MAEYQPTVATTIGQINAELEKIAQELKTKVSRLEESSRVMLADFDMNSNRILNLPAPGGPTDPVRLQDITDDTPSVTVHSSLLGRSAADQHPISSITGLQAALDSIVPAGSLIRDLYSYGGTVGGDCSAAMDAALADTACKIIVVPDNVQLTNHTITRSVTILGGSGVQFTGLAAGFRATAGKNIVVSGFRDFTLPTFPMSGGTASEGGIFFATKALFDVGNVAILGCSGSGGRIGVAVGPEGGSGIIRGLFLVDGCQFSGNNGVSAGTGYGVQFANELVEGYAVVQNTVVREAGRNSFYFARNAGGSPVFVHNCIAIDHRKNATNKGAGAFPSFNVARSSNVHGTCNQSIRPFDGSLLIGPEYDGAAVLNSKNITWRDFTIDSPANAVPQIFCEYLDVPTGARTDFVTFDGITYTTVGVAAPLIDYAYGKRILFQNIRARYIDILSGGYRLAFLKGGTTSNSGDIEFDNVRVVSENCAAADFAMFELASGILTNDIKLVVKNASYDVDSVVRVFWSPQAAVTNTRIEAYNCGTSGMVWGSGVSWYKGVSPSIQPVNRTLNLGQFSPVTYLTPEYKGEIILLTDTNTVWLAYGTLNTQWLILGRIGAGINWFPAIAVGRNVASGFAISATDAIFNLNTQGGNVPSSISVQGTFSVVDVTNTAVGSGTGKTPTLSTRSSPSLTLVSVTGCTGMTVGQPVYLSGELITSAITVNY